MSIVAKAIRVASAAHEGQVDKGGSAYILHPLRMMMRLRTSDEELMAIAVLHDVVEDCGVTLDELRAEGFSDRIVRAVNLLTRKPGERYESFIEQLSGSGNRDALRVRREDLRDNSEEN